MRGIGGFGGIGGFAGGEVVDCAVCAVEVRAAEVAEGEVFFVGGGFGDLGACGEEVWGLVSIGVL